MDYVPARSEKLVDLGKKDCPVAVLRSHPHFPNTLSVDLEGAVIGASRAWPETTIDMLLSQFDPPCHTNWKGFNEKHIEKRNGIPVFVIYVRPGPARMLAL